MVIKKSDLYSSLWSSCDELRGGMDASQYKDYVLTLLFMKYVSDKYDGKDDALIDVPSGGSFSDMVKLKGDKEIGDKINKIIGKLAEANDLQDVINVADFNDDAKLGRGQDMQDRLSKLIAIFDSLDFRSNRAGGDDLLGDAYEYLMRHFATESGKSKGQFYTPAEVSRVIAQVVGIGTDTSQDQSIYDPTCGSGSLLLKAADEAPRGLTIYGQENDNATWALAKMNMILHGHPTAELWRDNTLAAPYFKNPDGSLRTFDFAVANPPFSAKAWANGIDPLHDIFNRFEYGVPPATKGDYAFLLHVIKSLKSTGQGAIILPHGVLFRGHKEGEIRKGLVKHKLIRGVIGLPGNLFYGTGIPACIIVIDKKNADTRSGIFMIDASKGFTKDGNKNRLREQDIHKIVDVFTSQSEVIGYSRMVPLSEIESPENDCNLNIPHYIDPQTREDIHDLNAHLLGGIPESDLDALDNYWKVFPALRQELFRPGDRIGYSQAKLKPNEVMTVIEAHPEFVEYESRVTQVFQEWTKAHLAYLRSLDSRTTPKAVIYALSEDLLHRFATIPLLDPYDAYQQLMNYWTDIMQDDVYLVTTDGWTDSARPRLINDDKTKKTKETPDLVIGRKKYKMDLVPPELIVKRFFGDERSEISTLETTLNNATFALEQLVDENSGDDGYLEEIKNDKGKITKAAINDRLKELKNEPDVESEVGVLTLCRSLLDAEAVATKAVKDAEIHLDAMVLSRYDNLSETEIKQMVVDDKWLASIHSSLFRTVRRLILSLAGRLRELENRYDTPLPLLEKEVEVLNSAVAAHLRDMGLEW